MHIAEVCSVPRIRWQHDAAKTRHILFHNYRVNLDAMKSNSQPRTLHYATTCVQ
jgi:hypothetical protein